MSKGYLAYIIPIDLGAHPDHPIVIPPGSLPHPDQGLPGSQPRPDQGLPPYPDQGLPGSQPRPDQGLPGNQPYPDQGLPAYPSHPIVYPPTAPPYRPTHPIYNPAYPDQGLPQPQPKPDQGLPSDQPKPDQGLPKPQPGTPSHPINTPPDDGKFYVLVFVPGSGWEWVAFSPGDIKTTNKSATQEVTVLIKNTNSLNNIVNLLMLQIMSNVYFVETCDNPNSFLPENEDEKATPNTCHGWEIYGENGLSQVTYAGRPAARFEVNKEWGQDHKGDYRNEVTIVKAEDDDRVTEEGWYGFRILFPNQGGQSDERKTSHNQWFEDGGNELTLRTMQGMCFLELEKEGADGEETHRWDLYSNKYTNDNSCTGFVKHPLEQWDQFTFHIHHSADDDGFIKVYRGNQKIHEWHGATIHSEIPKWKIGEYSSFTKSTVPFKVVYFTDIKVGNDQASLEEMIGSSEVIPPVEPVEPPIEPPIEPVEPPVEPPPTQAGNVITGFFLVNAATEEVVEGMGNGTAMKNGESYSIKKYGSKLNVLTETGTDVTRVDYLLSGTYASTTKDKGKPFSLWGDDGKGNFYYGDWGNPPKTGSYTIKATPSNAAGAKGTPSTITFTLIA